MEGIVTRIKMAREDPKMASKGPATDPEHGISLGKIR